MRLSIPFLSRRSAEPVARHLPEGLRVYAIGDVHGRLDRLTAVEGAIERDLGAHPRPAEALVILIGDYVDRGPDSRGVIERLRRGGLAGLPTRCLRGNHEAALLEFLADGSNAEDWLTFGGLETLQSYGVRPRWSEPAPAEMEGEEPPTATEVARRELAAAMPDTHRAFLETLETSILLGDYLFVHAGVRPGVELDAQSEEDMLWIRDAFLTAKGQLPWRVVHGHTIFPEPVIGPNRISIDTGAYASGQLTCVAIEGDAARVVEVGVSDVSAAR